MPLTEFGGEGDQGERLATHGWRLVQHRPSEPVEPGDHQDVALA
ncbi:hypothetical protein ACFWAY_18085 [Rhodococcus sp. NPDC059968]